MNTKGAVAFVNFVKRYPLSLFFFLAYLLSWYPFLFHLASERHSLSRP